MAACGASGATPLLLAGALAAREPSAPRLFALALGAHFAGLFSSELLAARLPPVPVPALFATAYLLCTLCGISPVLLKLAPLPAALVPILALNGLLAGLLPALMARERGRAGTLFASAHLAPLLFALPLALGLTSKIGYHAAAVSLSLGATVLAAAAMVGERAFQLTTLASFAISACLPPAVGMFARIDAPSRVRLTESRGENKDFPGIPRHALYLDGRTVFSSADEQGDHLCLVGVGAAAAGEVRRALILGGGDGLSARNLLAYPHTQAVTVVERVAALARMGESDLKVRMYNLDSLRSRKVSLEVAEPLQWLRAHAGRESFDLVVIDEPPSYQTRDLSTKSLEAMRLLRGYLRNGGALAVRVGPALSGDDPSHRTVSSSAAIVRRTLESAGFSSLVYTTRHLETGYALGVAGPLPDPAGLFRRSALSHFCTIDLKWRYPAAEPHRLLDPRLSVAMANELPKLMSKNE